jgi:hypothetical protein
MLYTLIFISCITRCESVELKTYIDELTCKTAGENLVVKLPDQSEKIKLYFKCEVKNEILGKN